jgi:hypothetical protein
VSTSTITLTARDRRSLIRLIGILQTHLESAIECSRLPGSDVAQRGYKRQFAKDRADWRTAEEWVKRLEGSR